MLKKYALRYGVLILLLMSFATYGQEKTVTLSGQIVAEDSASTPLDGAIICVPNEDSTQCRQRFIANSSGHFSFEVTSKKGIIPLAVTYFGYLPYRQTITADRTTINLGTIRLKQKTDLLPSVEIEHKIEPVIFKRDTTVFNADAFITPENAYVEDLLRLLPGMEVNPDGTITYNGQKVDQVLVDGEPFFSSSITFTTRNLPKTMLASVEVTSTKTDRQAFLGTTGDSEFKTINLVTKPSKKKGVFGFFTAGYGTDNRYQASGNLNLFKDKQRIGLMAGSNNINHQQLSPGISGLIAPKNSAQGLSHLQNYGLSYSNTLTEHLTLSIDYMGSTVESESAKKAERENLLPESHFFTFSENSGINKNNQHNVKAKIQYQKDTTIQLIWKPSFSGSIGKNTNFFNQYSTDTNQDLTNRSVNNTTSDKNDIQFSNDLSLIKPLGNKGGALTLSLFQQSKFNASNDTQINTTEIFDSLNTIENRDQFSEETLHENKWKANADYTMPLSNKAYRLSFMMFYEQLNRTQPKSTYDKSEPGDEFDQFNTDQSFDFNYSEIKFYPQVGLLFDYTKWSGKFVARGGQLQMQNKDKIRPDQQFSSQFNFAEVESSASYRSPSPDAPHFNFSYSFRSTPPGIRQLQPFENITNPLNTHIGNPDLKMQNAHSINAGMISYKREKKSSFFTNISASAYPNQVVSITNTDANFVQQTTYTNVDGAYQFSSSFVYSKTFIADTVHNVQFRGSFTPNFMRSINLNNGTRNTSSLFSLPTKVELSWYFKKLFQLRVSYQPDLSFNFYNQTQTGQQQIARHEITGDLRLYLTSKLTWLHGVYVTHTPNQPEGFRKTVTLWNTTLQYEFFEDKAMVFIKVYDLLNQNIGLTRTANPTYTESSETLQLQRYFMFGASWTIRQF